MPGTPSLSPSDDVLDNILSVDEAAEIAGVSSRTMYRLVETGKVKGKKFGKNRTSPVAVSRPSLEDFLKKVERDQSKN